MHLFPWIVFWAKINRYFHAFQVSDLPGSPSESGFELARNPPHRYRQCWMWSSLWARRRSVFGSLSSVYRCTMHTLLSNVFVFGLGKGLFKELLAFWRSSCNTLTFPCLQSSRSLDLEGSGLLFVVKSTKDVGVSNGPLKNGMPPFTLGFIWRGLSVGCWVISCYSWWFLVCLQYLEGL